MTGLLIAFEGGEGAGKTTQVDRLAITLIQQGITPVVTRAPGGTPLGEQLRRVLLDAAPGTIPTRVEALLYAADQAILTATVIEPALAQGAVVITDRFIDSMIAYQGFGRKLGPGHISTISDFAVNGRVPDLVVLLDLPPRIGLARAATRSHPDRIESEELEFHQLVKAGFLIRARAGRTNYLVCDAAEPADKTAAGIAKHVLHLIDAQRRNLNLHTTGKVIAMKERGRK